MRGLPFQEAPVVFRLTNYKITEVGKTFCGLWRLVST